MTFCHILFWKQKFLSIFSKSTFISPRHLIYKNSDFFGGHSTIDSIIFITTSEGKSTRSKTCNNFNCKKHCLLRYFRFPLSLTSFLLASIITVDFFTWQAVFHHKVLWYSFLLVLNQKNAKYSKSIKLSHGTISRDENIKDKDSSVRYLYSFWADLFRNMANWCKLTVYRMYLILFYLADLWGSSRTISLDEELLLCCLQQKQKKYHKKTIC
jgi:hypothetical protein